VKPARFRYARPDSLARALDLLAAEGARALAGGQSLIPMLNFRLARPHLLVDLGWLDELSGIELGDDGGLRIGAMTRQSDLLGSGLIATRCPLLRQAVSHVGHTAIRNRGTIGGSVAHADPAAELPVALTALDARFHVASSSGQRMLTASELFRGAYTTALARGELLVGIELPPVPAGSAMAFAEYRRTQGAFATAGVAVVHAPGQQAAIALLGAGPVPVRVGAAEQALAGGASVDEVAVRAAAPAPDDHRRALIAALMKRALRATVRT
jgi:CO/xanthine dehydrogenase FAD-binding subunit